MMVQLENSLGAENGVIKDIPETHTPEEMYIARTLVREERVVPVGVPNSTSRDQRMI
jgi:hypothetical protein